MISSSQKPTLDIIYFEVILKCTINAAILMSYQLFIFIFCNLATMVQRVGNIQSKGYLEICHSLDLHYEE